jgi:hypothetical protein
MRKSASRTRPLLIIGKPASSKLWFRLCQDRGIVCKLLFSFLSELSSPYWQRLLRRYRPWALLIVSDKDTTSRMLLAEVCKQEGLPCVTWQGAAPPDAVSVQDALDLFIDETMLQDLPEAQMINTTYHDRK